MYGIYYIQVRRIGKVGSGRLGKSLLCCEQDWVPKPHTLECLQGRKGRSAGTENFTTNKHNRRSTTHYLTIFTHLAAIFRQATVFCTVSISFTVLTIFFSSSASFWSSFNSLNLKGHRCARNKATHGWLYLAALVNLNFCLNSYTLLHSPFFLVGEASQPKRMTADRVQLWQVPACCRCCSFLELRHASTEQPSSRQSKIAVMQPSSHSKTGGGGGGACQVTVNPCHVLSCSCALSSVLSCFIVLPCTGSNVVNVVNSPLVMASSTVSRQSSPQESVDIGLLFLLGFGQ